MLLALTSCGDPSTCDECMSDALACAGDAACRFEGAAYCATPCGAESNLFVDCDVEVMELLECVRASRPTCEDLVQACFED